MRSGIEMKGFFLSMAIALGAGWIFAGTAGASHDIPNVQRVKSLTAIPAGAEIIVAAPWARGKTAQGHRINELYAMDARGENRTQITHNGHMYNHFAVSPDRKRIAAIRYRGDTNGDGRIGFRDRKTLWIIDLEKKVEWPLLERYDAGWGGVDWSPDGRHVYLSVLVDMATDIYRLRPDGTGLFNVTRSLERILVPGAPGKWVSDVSVSFDGRWIAFLFAPREGPGRFDFRKKNVIAVCRVDGSGARIVTDGGSLPPGMYGPWSAGDFDPEFSPDGKRLVFQRATDLATNWAGVASHDIMVVNLDGSGLRRLSPRANTGVHGIADWSWDNRIVFSEWNKKDRYVGPVLVNADGSGYHRLLKARGGTHARWIPRLRK